MNTGTIRHKGASCRVAIPKGLPLEMWSGVREIASLEVPEAKRGQGIGSALMRKLTREADRSSKVLFLTAAEPDLVPFYERFGFGVIQFDPILMSRSPANA